MKNDINNIRFLKRILNEQEFKDFVELIKKGFTVNVVCDGNIRIDYFNSEDLAYSYIIDKDVGIKKEFEVGLNKFYIKLLDKLLKDKTFLQLLRQCENVSLNKDYAYFYSVNKSFRYYYQKPIKLKVSRLIPKGDNLNEV
jgi:hypothetical protein